MPIATFKPTANNKVKPKTPSIAPDGYKSITLSHRDTPIGSLINLVGGTPWKVDYYSQVLHTDDTARNIDIYSSPSFQKVNLIKHLEIMVTEGLSSSIEASSNISVTTGAGTAYNAVEPNTGDVFIGELLNLSTYLFRVTSVRPLSHVTKSHYHIEYRLEEPITTSDTKYIDLSNKIENTYYFDKALLESGSDYLVIDYKASSIEDLSKLYSNVNDSYFNRFISKTSNLLTFESDIIKLYDHHLSDFVMKTLDHTKHDMRMVSINPGNLTPRNIWDLLLNRDTLSINTLETSLTIVKRSSFRTTPMLATVAYTPTTHVIVSSDSSKPDVVGYRFDEIFDITNIDITTLFTRTYKENDTEILIIKPIMIDAFYVLSDGFYNTTNDVTLLESLVRNYINNNPIDAAKLLVLYEDYKNWGLLEQFYYTPILLLLTKYTLTTI